MRIKFTEILFMILFVIFGKFVLSNERGQINWRHKQDENLVVKREILRIKKHREGIDIQTLDHDEDKIGKIIYTSDLICS